MLEGKVQKIASEIKWTKGILHAHNPDDSKLVLSAIQSKICGIEKAVADAVRGTASQQGSSKVMKANCQDKNKFVSGHSSSGVLERHSSDRSGSDFNDESLSSIDENPIAVKFLASLDLEQGEPSHDVVNLASEHVTVQATWFEESMHICSSICFKEDGQWTFQKGN